MSFDYKMQLKELIDQCFLQFDCFCGTDIITPEIQDRFTNYFLVEPNQLCTENIISDECLFRDYSRLGGRKVDFSRIRNPFTLSKFTISNYEKTWFLKSKKDEIEGPFNAYDMDGLFKKERITEDTLVGFQKAEFFTFKYFIDIVYPLPKTKQSYNEVNTTFKGLTLFANEPKINKILDESDRQSSRSKSPEKANFNKEDTPFKRTPFKNVIPGLVPGESGLQDHFVQVESKSKGFNSDNKKNAWLMQSGSNVGERFLVKSSKHNRNKQLAMSSNGQFNIEMNDIIGNYTAIKRVGDEREYVDLRTKLDFKINHVQEEKSDEDEEIEVNFDEINVEKKK